MTTSKLMGRENGWRKIIDREPALVGEITMSTINQKVLPEKEKERRKERRKQSILTKMAMSTVNQTGLPEKEKEKRKERRTQNTLTKMTTVGNGTMRGKGMTGNRIGTTQAEAATIGTTQAEAATIGTT